MIYCGTITGLLIMLLQQNNPICTRADVLVQIFRKEYIKYQSKQLGNEISPFKIKSECIMSIRNTLAETIIRLIYIDPDARQESEPPSHEFNY